MADIWNIPMGRNDAGATTVGHYLMSLVTTLLQEGEGFSGKRPFGNSGWIGELEAALLKAGVVNGSMDSDGYVERVDEDEVMRLLLQACKDRAPAAQPVADQRTVKCRIALAVDPAGAWCAGGYVTGYGRTSDGFDYILDGLDDGEARYYVEVEVPIPTVPTIQAQATPAEGGGA